MNLAHFHLLLNHWPIIGTFIGLGFFLVALLGKSDDLRQATLALFSLVALLAIPTYVTGNLADGLIQADPGVSIPSIAAHQGAALLAFIFVEMTGAVAWVGLWQSRQGTRPPWRTMAAVLLCATVTVGLMTIAGNTGGAIRHPEVLFGARAAAFVAGAGAGLNVLIQFAVTGSSRWVWAVIEDVHFIGLVLLLGGTGILNLRVLGVWKRMPVGPLHRFIPWALAGLALNTATGMLLFLGMPYFYIFNADFHLKLVAVVLAGTNLLLHCTAMFGECEHLGPGDDAPARAKLLAGTSIVLWLAVVVLGRYMPYFEETLTPPGL